MGSLTSLNNYSYFYIPQSWISLYKKTTPQLIFEKFVFLVLYCAINLSSLKVAHIINYRLCRTLLIILIIHFCSFIFQQKPEQQQQS